MPEYGTTRHAEIIALAHEIKPTLPGLAWCEVCQEAERLLDTLADYALVWDFDADAALVAAHCPCLEDPAPLATRTAQDKARDKALYHLAQGVRVVAVGGAHLVPSGTRGGLVHRVQDGVCSCEASQHGRACWHVAAVELAGSVDELARAA